jgi:hypothetical protein
MGIRTISTGFDITTGSRRPALPLYRSTPALTEIAPMFTIEGFIESCRKAIVGPTRRQRSASSSPKRSPDRPSQTDSIRRKQGGSSATKSEDETASGRRSALLEPGRLAKEPSAARLSKPSYRKMVQNLRPGPSRS